jgi:hypothetical protein
MSGWSTFTDVVQPAEDVGVGVPELLGDADGLQLGLDVAVGEDVAVGLGDADGEGDALLLGDPDGQLSAAIAPVPDAAVTSSVVAPVTVAMIAATSNPPDIRRRIKQLPRCSVPIGGKAPSYRPNPLFAGETEAVGRGCDEAHHRLLAGPLATVSTLP